MSSSMRWDRLAVFVATGGWVGFLSPVPGTLGSVLGLMLVGAMSWIPTVAWQAVVITALILGGIPVCSLAARCLGGQKDPGAIIYDEIVVMPVVFLGVALLGTSTLLMGFVFFRLFDIVKPPPCKLLERLPGGAGIIADDLMAAVYAHLTLRIALGLLSG